MKNAIIKILAILLILTGGCSFSEEGSNRKQVSVFSETSIGKIDFIFRNTSGKLKLTSELKEVEEGVLLANQKVILDYQNTLSLELLLPSEVVLNEADTQVWLLNRDSEIELSRPFFHLNIDGKKYISISDLTTGLSVGKDFNLVLISHSSKYKKIVIPISDIPRDFEISEIDEKSAFVGHSRIKNKLKQFLGRNGEWVAVGYFSITNSEDSQISIKPYLEGENSLKVDTVDTIGSFKGGQIQQGEAWTKQETKATGSYKIDGLIAPINNSTINFVSSGNVEPIIIAPKSISRLGIYLKKRMYESFRKKRDANTVSWNVYHSIRSYCDLTTKYVYEDWYLEKVGPISRVLKVNLSNYPMNVYYSNTSITNQSLGVQLFSSVKILDSFYEFPVTENRTEKTKLSGDRCGDDRGGVDR